MFLSRDFYIPKHSTKVADKASDAVAYIYDNASGKPCAAVFYGKQAKPVAQYRYKDAAEREKAITRMFQTARDHAARKETQKAEAQSAADVFAKTLEVGDIFYTSWGYDQTNIDYYEITAISGRCVTLRKIGAASEDLGYDWRYKCAPQSGEFIGEPTRHIVRGSYLKVDDHYAHKWNTSRVAGVPVGPALQGGGCH